MKEAGKFGKIALSSIVGVVFLTGATVATMPGESEVIPNPDCWVQIWEDENFQDDNDRIMGPGKWGSMRGLPGANKTDWGDEIDSIRMGPKATGIFWEDEDFKDNSIRIGPGQERHNLRGSPDMGDTIDSMEITCQP